MASRQMNGHKRYSIEKKIELLNSINDLIEIMSNYETSKGRNANESISNYINTACFEAQILYKGIHDDLITEEDE